jgi:hypothetical protein
MEEILSGCALFEAVLREPVGSGRTWSTTLASPFLNSCRVCASPNFQEFLLFRFFHFDDFNFSVFLFFVFRKNFFGANDRVNWRAKNKDSPSGN